MHPIPPPALCLTALMLATAGCQMPHLQQPVAEPESPPQQTGGETGEETPEPRPVGATPSLAIADVSASESDGTLTFTVSLSFASGDPVTVRYATGEGTATAGADYDPASDTLTFPADSSAAQTIAVALRDDAVAEPAETFTLRLGDPQGATLAADAATGTISDDDRRAVAVRPAALNVTEGASGSYTVALSSQPTAPVTVLVTAAAEVSIAPAALVFTPRDWARERTVTVTAVQDEDAVADAPVELVHTVRGGDYERTPAAPVAVTIVEDDTQSLAVAPARAAEGAGVLRFAVSLSLQSDAEVTVDYATGAAGDTAAAGSDYTHTSGMLRFAARSTEPRTIEVTVSDDAVDEPDEQLTVTLSNPTHAVLAGGGDTAAATGTIEDDDAAPLVRIADASLSEGGGSMRFAVTLDRRSARTVTVAYATADVTARAGADYTQGSGTLTFAAATTARTVAVPVADDALDEDTERFTVTLSAAVDATVEAGGKTATGTIGDDDAAPLVRIADASLSEGGGSMRFAVTLDPQSGRRVTVAYATADGTAAAGTDYTQASGTLTFPAGTTARTVAVPVADDALDEDTETFAVTLSGAQHAVLPANAATGTITDDDTRGVQVQPAALSLSEGGDSASYTVVLTSRPTAAVTVGMTAAAEVSITPAELAFTETTWATAQTVTVTASADATAGATVTIAHTVSGGDYAGESAASVTVTITEPTPLELAALQVTGGGTMYPAFDGAVRHYAVTCADSTTLQVTAQAHRTAAQLTLLRADTDDNQVSTAGSLDARVTVNGHHDVAIELRDGGDTTTYVVHCIPSDFPDIRILKKNRTRSEWPAVRYAKNTVAPATLRATWRSSTITGCRASTGTLPQRISLRTIFDVKDMPTAGIRSHAGMLAVHALKWFSSTTTSRN